MFVEPKIREEFYTKMSEYATSLLKFNEMNIKVNIKIKNIYDIKKDYFKIYLENLTLRGCDLRSAKTYARNTLNDDFKNNMLIIQGIK